MIGQGIVRDARPYRAQSLYCLLGLELHDKGRNNGQCHDQVLGGRHIFYSYQILRARGLELVLGPRVSVTLFAFSLSNTWLMGMYNS